MHFFLNYSYKLKMSIQLPDELQKRFASCINAANKKGISLDDVGGCCMTDMSDDCPKECMAAGNDTLCGFDS